MTTKDTFELIVQQRRNISPQVLEVSFIRTDGQSLDYIPGQFISIHFTFNGQELRRSYSISSISNQSNPSQARTIDIAISYVKDGPGTEYLYALKPGDRVDASGPQGRLILQDEQPQRYLLLATGTGVTPFRCMLPELARRIQQHEAKVVCLQGVKRREDLLYEADFLAMAKAHPEFQFVACYSREPELALKPYERAGYVQTILAEFHPNPENDIVYLCGNPNMIDHAFESCKALGFPSSHVRREKYISPKARA